MSPFVRISRVRNSISSLQLVNRRRKRRRTQYKSISRYICMYVHESAAKRRVEFHARNIKDGLVRSGTVLLGTVLLFGPSLASGVKPIRSIHSRSVGY